MICKMCSEDYNPAHPMHKGGHFGVCGECEPKHKVEVNKTVGFWDVTGKSDYRMEIIRDPNDAELSMVKRMGRCGPGHCHTSLGLSSSGANTPKGNMDSVHSKLYNEEQP